MISTILVNKNLMLKSLLVFRHSTPIWTCSLKGTTKWHFRHVVI